YRHDDNEEMTDLTEKQWELHENVSTTPDSVYIYPSRYTLEFLYALDAISL
ncbi:hypothetical protein Tco_1180021, partial [Tanacetum coccineum]